MIISMIVIMKITQKVFVILDRVFFMNIIEVSDELYLVDLPQKIEGFRKFISSWIFQDGARGLIVDVGPASTIDKLLEALKYLGIEKVEYILLTHIHIDHAGGVGKLLDNFPEAKIVVSEKGVKHIVNPKRLWEASKQTLGKVAEEYGEPLPVKESCISDKNVNFAGIDVEILDTPGHAPHHQSYLIDEFLFIGEAAGVHIPLKNDYYLRPATPPKFMYEIADSSLEKLHSLGSKRVCFGHFGFKRDSLEIVEKARKQLKLWLDTVYDIACKRDFEDEREIISHAKQELLERDSRFSRYLLLDDDIKQREDFFIQNTLRGILDYVKSTMCEP
jgi:glyoxylase-like metal-dependent hydrolase (beta-lactamase superfamily II)